MKPKILSLTTMFPNPKMPVHAQFVKQRLDALSNHLTITVVSPIPWFPGEKFFNRYRNRSQIPSSTQSNLYPTYFPKFFSFPMIFKPLDGLFLALATFVHIKKSGLDNDFDILDCHLGFPDGTAGALLSKWLKKPFTVTLRGHDINDLYKYPLRIKQVIWGLNKSQKFFGVAQALVNGAEKLGAEKGKGISSANGINPERFHFINKPKAKQNISLNVNHQYLLSVGHLVPRKGFDIIIKAFALIHHQFPNLRLIIIGKGGEEGNCEETLKELSKELGVHELILWQGAVLNDQLNSYYCSAELFLLATEKEGMPNVVVESIACGTPAIATSTWGIPEVIDEGFSGMLVEHRNAESFAKAIKSGLTKNWFREQISNQGKKRTWDVVALELKERFTDIYSASN